MSSYKHRFFLKLKFLLGSGELRVLVRGSRRGSGSGFWPSREQKGYGGYRDLSCITAGRQDPDR